MSRDETATDAERRGESRPVPLDSAPHVSDSETSIEPGGASPATSVHWLARVAERAGLEGKRPTIAPDMAAKEAWPVVTRTYKITYKIGDSRLCELVSTYFRLDIADFGERDPNAPLLMPEVLARRYHVYPLYETDKHLLVATCDPTQVEAERALGFSTGRTTVF